jgi:aldose 1-epimerase
MKTFQNLLVVLMVCSACSRSHLGVSVSKIEWGRENNQPVFLFTLANEHGMEVQISNYGGTVIALWVPDKDGKKGNIVLGLDSLPQYVAGHPFFGSLVGRYANRINRGMFSLDTGNYQLSVNNGIHHLHGGSRGLYTRVFSVDTAYAAGDSAVVSIYYLSPHMEEGYPGNCLVRVTFSLDSQNELDIRYSAESDRPTIVNLTHHLYFNLSACQNSILQHELTLMADSITPVDSTLIPTGRLQSVSGTPYDFTQPCRMGKSLNQLPEGYDINFVLRKHEGMTKAAMVRDPLSGRVMEILTDQPGLQFYGGHFLDGAFRGSHGLTYKRYYGFCLEPQHFPDSPNQSGFPSTTLLPGETYRHHSIYRFKVSP